jgi:methionyl aminopeptidase
MTIETEQDLQGLLACGRVVALALQAMASAVEPGLTTAEVDLCGAAVLAAHGAIPAPRITYGFPGVACISVNDEATHGIPGARVIKGGDVVKFDISAMLNGYFTDAARTVIVPPAARRHEQLCAATREALEAAIDVAQAGRRISVIGRAAESRVRRDGFTMIGELNGHGVGRALHEDPSVPTVFRSQTRGTLKEGLVITIEPHASTGRGRIYTAADGWTLKTRDGGVVANFEHTVVITRGRPIVVTALPA